MIITNAYIVYKILLIILATIVSLKLIKTYLRLIVSEKRLNE